MREPAADHHRLQVDVEPRGDQRLVAARHHDQLVDELVVGAAPAAHLRCGAAFLRLGHRLDHEYLEVRLTPLLVAGLVFELAGILRKQVMLVESGVLDIA